uniref:Protein kinase domain-containing protein n=1 Tax=Grammatophora oceanica TaxID=210454 RepID=A0A7S1VDX5_9STRA
MVATTDKKVKRRNDAALMQRRTTTKSTTTTSESSFDKEPGDHHVTSPLNNSEPPTPPPSDNDCLANQAARKVQETLQKDSALFEEVPDIPHLSSDEVKIHPTKILGQGGFGILREGELRANSTTTTKLAIKQVRPVLAMKKPTVFANGAADLVTEGEILGRLDHPNIIRLYGVSNNLDFSHPEDASNSYFIALEPLQDGTLGKRMLEWQEEIAPTNKGGRKAPPLKQQLQLLKKRLGVALQIAKAIQYLHGKNILYRDLKSENVGFSTEPDGGTVKLFDFGLAKEIKKSELQKDKYNLTGNTGSRRYMAPEVAKGWAYNHRVDVYSFAILLWEIAACQRAFPTYTAEEFTTRVHQGEERPALTDWWPVELQWIIKKSWSFFANSRPDMDVVVETLEEVLEDMEKDEGVGRPTLASGANHSGGGGSSLRRFLRHTTDTFRHSKEGRPPVVKPSSHRPTTATTTKQQLPKQSHPSHLPPRSKTTGGHGHRRNGSGNLGAAGLFGFGLFAKHYAATTQQQGHPQSPPPTLQPPQQMIRSHPSSMIRKQSSAIHSKCIHTILLQLPRDEEHAYLCVQKLTTAHKRPLPLEKCRRSELVRVANIMYVCPSTKKSA